MTIDLSGVKRLKTFDGEEVLAGRVSRPGEAPFPVVFSPKVVPTEFTIDTTFEENKPATRETFRFKGVTDGVLEYERIAP